jgi:hypothetical protein
MLVDMAPTILAALGAPASIEHTGRVLHEVVGAEAKVERKVKIPGMPTGEETSSVSDTEADEMEEHLRGLGYLE